ncbi:DUF1707 domain-containing protein [Sphaerisporangium sp. TRM90804]|uniref:DUF1707 SHOCT-like domain-containing protein n=1 Tax=Sphaerisporangium sp. TRM90804 TaxID=3031113 RepID=UPI002449AA8C|nr:DUF1707 domain-containing protein [Sphaerisporangium sp. TRM90804]MDH2423814.1 DUF1707 domain-containing protein [Sphaerisporangium sp. TRM90804]
MAATPEMRASDGDRDKVAAALREHCAEGRLTIEEFNERLELVYQGRTYGDLQKLTADLPEIDLRARRQEVAKPTAKPKKSAEAELKAAWGVWLMVVAVCSVIWALTDFGGYFWPMWVGGPWGAILLVSTFVTAAGGGGQSKK